MYSVYLSKISYSSITTSSLVFKAVLASRHALFDIFLILLYISCIFSSQDLTSLHCSLIHLSLAFLHSVSIIRFGVLYFLSSCFWRIFVSSLVPVWFRLSISVFCPVVCVVVVAWQYFEKPSLSDSNLLQLYSHYWQVVESGCWLRLHNTFECLHHSLRWSNLSHLNLSHQI